MPNAKEESRHLGHLIMSAFTYGKIGNYLKKKKKSSHFHLVEQSFNTYVHNS